MFTGADDDKYSYLYWKLCKRIIACVRRHEKKRLNSNYRDCYVREDDLGPPQILFYVISLYVLTPRLVADLQKIMKGYPRWEIVVIVCPPDGSAAWPDMGLRIREREIIDDLQRQYFPPDFHDLCFEGARLGTAND